MVEEGKSIERKPETTNQRDDRMWLNFALISWAGSPHGLKGRGNLGQLATQVDHQAKVKRQTMRQKQKRFVGTKKFKNKKKSKRGSNQSQSLRQPH